MISNDEKIHVITEVTSIVGYPYTYVVYREEQKNAGTQYYYYDNKSTRQSVDQKDVHRAWNRALPDGEIAAGTPTPALIPMPTLGMAPMPAPVQVTDLYPWYDKGTGMGRRIDVAPKNWKRILDRFDQDKDGTLSEQERKTWYDAIDKAVADNTETKSEYGDPQYQWIPYALYDNPGYPFFIPGVAGHRPPHPPLDMAWKEAESKKKEEPAKAASTRAIRPLKIVDGKARWTNEDIKNELRLDPSVAVVKEGDVKYLDGGLPRHLVLGGDIVSQYNTRWDFSKDFVKTVKEPGPNGKTSHIGGLYAFQLPEEGTPIERAAMKAHSIRTRPTALPENGDAGNFILNGLPPIHGAPYADPSVTEDGNSSGIDRRYQAAVIQTDVVLNKKGWHYPQSRFITLWEDVAPTISNIRAPNRFSSGPPPTTRPSSGIPTSCPITTKWMIFRFARRPT